MTMKFDEHQAIREGWSLFETHIPGRWEEIERLDCPADSDDSLSLEPTFERDDAALEFVIHQAKLGSKYHIDALAIHCAGEPIMNGDVQISKVKQVNDDQHTPGPLRFFLPPESLDLPNGDSVNLWEVATGPVHNGFHTTGYTFTEEDARLYAAAPDLFDVVQEFCHDVKAIGIELDDWPDLGETHQHAVAALRKATPSQEAVKGARDKYRIEPGYSMPGMDNSWAVYRVDEDDETEELVAVVTTRTAAEAYIEACHGVLLCELNPPRESPV